MKKKSTHTHKKKPFDSHKCIIKIIAYMIKNGTVIDCLNTVKVSREKSF